MTSIRRVRKAFKRKYGIKTFTYRVYYKNNQNRPFNISPILRKKLRRVFTEKMRISGLYDKNVLKILVTI